MEQRQCECCQSGEVENAYHFVFDCPLYAQLRLEMTDMIDRLVQHEDHYGWRRMSWNQKFEFLLGDGPMPSNDREKNTQWLKMEVCLYNYLARACQARRALLE